jgi:hypothetical protein
VRIETRIDRTQSHETANEQRRSDQEHERQRHLCDDQSGAYARVPETSAGALHTSKPDLVSTLKEASGRDIVGRAS